MAIHIIIFTNFVMVRYQPLCTWLTPMQTKVTVNIGQLGENVLHIVT